MTVAIAVFVFYLAAATVSVLAFWVLQIRFGDTSDLDPNSFLVRKVAGKRLGKRCDAVAAAEHQTPQIARHDESSVETIKPISQYEASVDFYGQIPIIRVPSSVKSAPQELVDQVIQEYGQNLVRYKELIKTVTAAIASYEESKQEETFRPPYQDYPQLNEKGMLLGREPRS